MNSIDFSHSESVVRYPWSLVYASFSALCFPSFSASTEPFSTRIFAFVFSCSRSLGCCVPGGNAVTDHID